MVTDGSFTAIAAGALIIQQQMLSLSHPPFFQVYQGRAELAARDPLAGQAAQAHPGDRGALEVPDLLDHRATATRTPAWATMLEVNTCCSSSRSSSTLSVLRL